MKGKFVNLFKVEDLIQLSEKLIFVEVVKMICIFLLKTKTN